MSTPIYTRFATLASLAMAATCAFAQETPPATTEPDQAQATEEQEAPPPKPKRSWFSFGYNAWNPKGNREWMRAYATPTEGVTIRDLRLMSVGENGLPYARLTFRGMFGQDSFAEGLAIINQGKTVIRAERSEAEYYERTLIPPGISRDRAAGVTISHEVVPNVGGYFTYRETKDLHNYEAPKKAQEGRTRLVAGGVEGKLLGGQLGVTIADHRYYDYNNLQPTTVQRRLDAHYALDVTQNLSIEGNAGVTRFEQPGRPNSHARTYALSGWWDMGPTTSVQFNFGRQDMDLNAVQNAYTRKYLTSSARLMQRWQGWSFQLGLKHNEAERIRADQSYADVPKWNIWDARISGRVAGVLKLTARGNWQQLRGGAGMLTNDPRQLFWDDKALGEIKVQGGNEILSGYAGYAIRFWRNASRGSEVRWHNLTAGASYAFNPTILGYFEVAHDSVNAKGAEETGISLDDYFPSSTSVATGVDWTLTPLDALSASLNYFVTNNERGSQLTATYRRQISDGQAFDVSVAPWRFDDRLYGVGTYRSTIVAVNYTIKF